VDCEAAKSKDHQLNEGLALNLIAVDEVGDAYELKDNCHKFERVNPLGVIARRHLRWGTAAVVFLMGHNPLGSIEARGT
jgi:hypothetical protein